MSGFQTKVLPSTHIDKSLSFRMEEALEVGQAFTHGSYFVTPALFYQIHTKALREGSSYVAYSLLPGKSREVCIVALTLFKEKLDAFG